MHSKINKPNDYVTIGNANKIKDFYKNIPLDNAQKPNNISKSKANKNIKNNNKSLKNTEKIQEFYRKLNEKGKNK